MPGGTGKNPENRLTGPEVSVVVPHYDDLVRLDSCLARLESQTLHRSRYEVIVADNGSSAGPEAVAGVIAGRARLVFAAERGAGPARNCGAAAATGPVLAFTDADCLPAADWLEQGLAALADPARDFLGGHVAVLVADRSRMTGAEAFEAIFAFDNRTYVERKGFSITANLFVPRAVFERVGPFRTQVSEDLDWCWRARTLGYRIGYADQVRIAHPARRDWPQLRSKWQRLMAESRALWIDRRRPELGWLARTWLLPLSILRDLPRVLGPSSCLPDWRSRFAALGTLIHLRFWRFGEGHRLLLQKGLRA